jgi:hypothetical protein
MISLLCENSTAIYLFYKIVAAYACICILGVKSHFGTLVFGASILVE